MNLTVVSRREKLWSVKKNFLTLKLDNTTNPEFIVDDPIQIPHRFTQLQDIEIAGFFAAMMAWGQRKQSSPNVRIDGFDGESTPISLCFITNLKI